MMPAGAPRSSAELFPIIAIHRRLERGDLVRDVPGLDLELTSHRLLIVLQARDLGPQPRQPVAERIGVALARRPDHDTLGGGDLGGRAGRSGGRRR